MRLLAAKLICRCNCTMGSGMATALFSFSLTRPLRMTESFCARMPVPVFRERHCRSMAVGLRCRMPGSLMQKALKPESAPQDGATSIKDNLKINVVLASKLDVDVRGPWAYNSSQKRVESHHSSTPVRGWALSKATKIESNCRRNFHS